MLYDFFFSTYTCIHNFPHSVTHTPTPHPHQWQQQFFKNENLQEIPTLALPQNVLYHCSLSSSPLAEGEWVVCSIFSLLDSRLIVVLLKGISFQSCFSLMWSFINHSSGPYFDLPHFIEVSSVFFETVHFIISLGTVILHLNWYNLFTLIQGKLLSFQILTTMKRAAMNIFENRGWGRVLVVMTGMQHTVW